MKEVIKHKNFVNTVKIKDNCVYELCNFAKEEPFTEIRVNNCEFIRCNLKNCSIVGEGNLFDNCFYKQISIDHETKKFYVYGDNINDIIREGEFFG